MAPHSSTLAWKIPWTEEPGRLQSMGSLGVGHDWATSLSLFTFMHWRRKCNPLQCSCMENPRDGGAWWAAGPGVAQSRTWLKRLSSSSRVEQTLTKGHIHPGRTDAHGWCATRRGKIRVLGRVEVWHNDVSLKSLVSKRLKGMGFQTRYYYQKNRFPCRDYLFLTLNVFLLKFFLENQKPIRRLHFPSTYFNVEHSSF